MVKVTFDNWETLKLYMERIREEKIEDTSIEATLFMSNEAVKKLLEAKVSLEDSLPEERSHGQKEKEDNCLPEQFNEECTEEKKETASREKASQEETVKPQKRRRKEWGESKKKIFSYIQEQYGTGKPVTAFELMQELGLKRFQVTHNLNVLLEDELITKVSYGKYELREDEAEGIEESKLSKEMKRLKDLYQKPDYQKVIDYIYTKNCFEVEGTRNLFIMEERMIADVINLSLKAGFIEKTESSQKKTVYKVKPIARVWFAVLHSNRANIDTINGRIHDFSKKQLESALKEGMEKEILVFNEIRKTYSVA